MSGRGKGGRGPGSNKKAKTSYIEEFKWKRYEGLMNANKVFVVNYCDDIDGGIVSAIVPLFHMEKHLLRWYTNFMDSLETIEFKLATLTLNFGDPDDNDQLKDFFHNKDLRQLNSDECDEKQEKDDDEEEGEEDDEEDDEDDEIEDICEVLEPIATWMTESLPKWNENPPDGVPLIIMGTINATGDA